MNRNKRARHEYITWNISRSLSHTKRARYTCNISRSLSHEENQARYTWKISRSLSHTKQAHCACTISRSFSHEAKQTRYTCNISRSFIHEAKQARYVVLKPWGETSVLHMKYTRRIKSTSRNITLDSISRSFNHRSWTIFSQIPLIEFPIATELPECLAE